MFLYVFCSSFLSFSQININNSKSPIDMANILGDNSITISNVSYKGDNISSASFTAAGVASTELGGLTEGIVLTTTSNANNITSSSLNYGSSGIADSDIALLIGANQTTDTNALEFDFIANSNELSFRYLFASEEYRQYVCTQFNDAFGFFLSGPGISGPYSDNSINLALLPNGLPVAVNTVNGGNIVNGNAATCLAIDSGFQSGVASPYYNANGASSYNGFEGLTDVFTATATIIPGEKYHIKLVISDTGNNERDSGVFIEADSFSTGVITPSTTLDFDGADDFIEAPAMLSEATSATMMSWVKLDNTFDGGDIMGQGNYHMFLDGTRKLKTSITTPTSSNPPVDYTLNLYYAGSDYDASDTSECNENWEVYSSKSYVRIKDLSTGNFLPTTYHKNTDCPTTYTISLNSFSDYEIHFYVHHNNLLKKAGYELIDFDGNVVSTGNTSVRFHPGPRKTFDIIKFTVGGTVPAIVTNDANAPTLDTEKWYHVASVYDGPNNVVKNYLNGELQWTDTNVTGNLIANIKEFQIGRNPESWVNYFEGSITETRVYDVALTETQLREQIYQRVIESVGGKVHGAVIPKDIDGGSLSWSNLVAYYGLDTVTATGEVLDVSTSLSNALAFNMTTVQSTNAPLPYVANNNTTEDKWSASSAWQYGTVWDIPSKDWAIVKVTNSAKLIAENSHTLLGAIVDTGSELSIETDKSLTVSSYLKLDGHLDLVGESQLIQTTGSTFEPASLGYLERDQQGKSNIYSYNYWSSPVYPTGSSSNNALYSVSNILKSGVVANNPLNINFTSASQDGSTTPGGIMTVADYWIWKYSSQPGAYANWQHLRSTGEIKPGEGYTMKGTNAASQNYVFTGKPNNGDITHQINGNDIYLVGNPYASALNADQFIDDNIGVVANQGDIAGQAVTTGALYFWEHFTTNNSHVLAQYEGGYATYTKLGGVIAVSHQDISSNGTGTIRPGRNVPVGQGFFVKASTSGGDIKFNNAQRVFKIESVVSDPYNIDNSIFTRNSNTNMPTENNDDVEKISSDIQRLYFKFTNTDGYQRELLLGVKEGLEEGLNYGYDAMLLDNFVSDCSWLLNENSKEKLVIQAIGSMYDSLQLPLHIKADKTGNFKFEVTDLSDIDSSTSVYLYDKELDSSFPLEAGVPVEFYLEEGEYSDRFKVVFKVAKIEEEAEEVLENIDTADNLVVFYNTKTQSIDITNTTQFSAKNIAIHNVLGQQIANMNTEFKDQNLITIPVSLATGAYVVTFDYDNKRKVTKKLMIR